MNALILAAGVGERMRPITDSLPKPLLPIVNQRLIDVGVQKLTGIGIHRIGINLFHKHEALQEHVKKYGDIVHTVVEDELMGTGGALVNFADFLKDDFVLHSCDVVSDARLKEVIDFHKKHEPMATLLLVKHKGIQFSVGKDNRVEKMIPAEEIGQTYAGIGVFSERVFSLLPQKKTFSIVDLLKNILDNDEVIMALPAVMHWQNINSPYTYWKIHHDILHGNLELPGFKIDSNVYIAPTSTVQTTELKGFVSINENCFVARDVYLENTIVLPKSRIKSGNYRNCVLSDRLRMTVA
jgi:mannose-1-phosphate guanylyltransferase/phosphomannomutase